MRRALRPHLPELAMYFGLRWPEIEHMPRAELYTYLAALEQIRRNIEEVRDGSVDGRGQVHR